MERRAELEEEAGVKVIERRVIHDTKGHPNYSRGDVTDKPCPPITVGHGAADSSHYKVVERVLEQSEDAVGGGRRAR